MNLTLVSMTQGGEAMGRDATGRVVFVPYAIAGEEVVAEIVEEKKSYARARLVEIVKPSPARITPRCPHFAPPPSSPLPPSPSPVKTGEGEGGARGTRVGVGCGGCQWQHIAYDAQLKFKTEIVREQFARIGKFPDAPVRDTIGMSEPWDYRNNVQFHVAANGDLCFRALESHDLVHIRECYIQHPLVYEMFLSTELEGGEYSEVTLRTGTQTGQKMLILRGRDPQPPEIAVDEPVSIAYQTPSGEIVSLIGRDAIHEELRGRAFRISPASFFQVNTALAEKLVDLVEEYLAPRPSDVLLDAYGGVGTFGLLLAPRVARVIEIEASASAIADARANAVDVPNVEFQRGTVEEILPGLKAGVDIAVADPPRAGMDRRALDALIALAPRAFAYVSCDPATLARDARRLVDGGYRLVEAQPVDLFPQTYHIETVCRFERLTVLE
ncbi:MAG: class I SAM-dependent RNA methyltransferase [Chloroflexi bacterium]|nr:class I SAM-dependent RNA methyltransferase [Chloroflexota bacterium]